MIKSRGELRKNARSFACLLPFLHFVVLFAICVTGVNEIVPRIGMIDFPLTLLASPVLMNIDVSEILIVLYYLIFGTVLWYVLGKFLDRMIGIEKR